MVRLPQHNFPEILVTAFSEANSVKGVFAYFSAGWFRQTAPGLVTYLNQSQAAPMKLTVSPQHYRDEINAMKTAVEMTNEQAIELVKRIFEEGRLSEESLKKHTFECLTWMLKVGKLELTIAVPKPHVSFHPKMWLFEDGEDQVLIHGSGNATGGGTMKNVEQMTMTVSWNKGENDTTLNDGIEMIDDWMGGRDSAIQNTFPLPEALKLKLITQAPENPPTQEILNTGQSNRNTEEKDPWESLKKAMQRPPLKPQAFKLSIPAEYNWETDKYSHQGKAVSAWLSKNPHRGILSMATGSGKTITAMIAATKVQNSMDKDTPFLIVVSAPKKTIIRSWKSEVEKFGLKPHIPSETGKQRTVTRAINGLKGGNTQVLIVTDDHLKDPRFRNTLRPRVEEYGGNDAVKMLLIGDEVHGLGAAGFIHHTPEFEFFENRLGLSATPKRQFDEEGTDELFNFFGDQVYEFGLKEAIGNCLTEYKYYVHAATLTGEDLEEYQTLTDKINSRRGWTDDDDTTLSKWYVKRRGLVETPTSKISLLEEVLKRRNPKKLKHALIYASSKNPEQFEQIVEVLRRLDIRYAKVTMAESAKPGLLNDTFESFEKGTIQVLLAKKILDEGVDIPLIREAFIVASGTGQREWTQRRGRCLRLHPDKQFALVHDFLGLPSVEDCEQEFKAVIRQEIERAYEFSEHAKYSVRLITEHIPSIRDAYFSDLQIPGSSDILIRAGDYYIDDQIPQGDPFA